MRMIDELFKWYLDNQSDLVGKYNGKYIVITKDGVQAAFDTEDDGYNYGVETFGRGNFMVQLCTEGKGAYTINFYSYNAAF